ncbi:MAG: Na+/H+ antiporter NhaA [Pseudomonadota bacterium]
MLLTIRDFLRLEAAGGIILMMTAALALVIANSPLDQYYDLLLDVPIEVRVGDFAIDKPILLWINDGLMAVFFFLVGLELKRELLEGELAAPGALLLPGAAAIGGIVAPVGLYAAINWGDPVTMQGWAIPAATDIAFALGILTLVGNRVPTSLKVFLVSLAIFDDIGAVVIIALFYTSDLSILALVVAAACLMVLTVLNRRGVTKISSYIWVGLIMWVAVLKSGVHATLAGVALALFIPMRDPENPDHSPVKTMEHDLHSLVAFFVLPVFAFANAGVSFGNMQVSQLLHPVTLGVAAGLFVGKQIGVFGSAWLVIKAGLAKLPDGSTFRGLYGVSIFSGVGFTMSLFIGSLAFQSTGVNQIFDERLGILVGSLFAGLLGFLILRGMPMIEDESD